MAAPSVRPPLVKTLLDAGAKVNVQDIRGMTPLMLAVATDRQNPEVIRALIAKGADANIKSLAGETALDWAHEDRRDDRHRHIEAGRRCEHVRAPPVLPAFAPVDLRTAAQRSVGCWNGLRPARRRTVAARRVTRTTSPISSTNLARTKGLQVDEKAASDRRALTRGQFFSPLNMLERLDVPGTPDTPLFALDGLANAGYTPDRITDGIVANVSAQQSSTGHWVVPHGAIARPPIEDGDIARTALGIGALKNYGAPGRAAEFTERIARASGWLSAAKATTS